MLLTATPVNNSLWDLFHQLGYFIRNDAAFADMGIPSVRDHFAKAMALNPDDLTPEHLFDVLDTVAVRRTRSFIKRYLPQRHRDHRRSGTNHHLPPPHGYAKSATTSTRSCPVSLTGSPTHSIRTPTPKIPNLSPWHATPHLSTATTRTWKPTKSNWPGCCGRVC